MVRTGFDLRPLQARFKAHKERGIGVYTRNLISRGELAKGALEILPFHDPLYESLEPLSHGSTELSPGLFTRIVGGNIKEYFRQHLLSRRDIDTHCVRNRIERLFFPTHLDAPAGLKCGYVTTAHDMISSALREKHYTSIKSSFHIRKQIETLRTAEKIVAVSEHTRSDVIKYTGIDPGKIDVVYNGVEPDFHPGVTADAERFDLPEKFVLYVGGIDWRKNMELLFDAFAGLANTDRDSFLVMTGDIESDPLYLGFMERLKKSRLESRVRSLGYVSKPELVALYNRATLFFYPSLYEGFGLPVLEAMACGVPVLTTNCASIPEVAGDACVTLDPDKPEFFASELKALMVDGARRAEMSEKGIERARKFTWEKCAEETFSVIGG